MADLQAVFLDFGNVLVFHDDHVLPERLSALGGKSPQEVRAALKPLWDRVHRGQLAGDDLRRAVAEAAGAALDQARFDELWTCYFRVHDEVLPLVSALCDRMPVFLLSNTNAAHFDRLRPRVPVLERFAGYVLSHELGVVKPEPAIFQAALRRAGVPADRTAFFDDVAQYVEAAARLGIHGRVFTDAASFATQLAALGLTL
jgi:putative hydrolase of the HAD superfamily